MNREEAILARITRIEAHLVRLCEFCSGWTDVKTPDGGRSYHPPGSDRPRPKAESMEQYQLLPSGHLAKVVPAEPRPGPDDLPPDSGERLLLPWAGELP